jgi:fumarylacetoacetase
MAAIDTRRALREQRSFIGTGEESHFPIQNLPYGIFRRAGEHRRVGVAIGDMVLDLGALEKRGFFADAGLGATPVFQRTSLNWFMSLGRGAWRQVRTIISRLLSADEPRLRDDPELRRIALLPQAAVEMCLPAEIGDYTDFYSSREHATNVGTMFRGKEHALPPNYLWMPIAYHGRASSVVLSGTDLHRPCGQTWRAGAAAPEFGPSRRVDFELELGFLIGPGSALGQPIPVETAAEHIFGLVLVNDWSARDIQQWEYVPLGPFLAKNFGTSVSPWVVTLDALEPFRRLGPVQDPPPLPYLRANGERAFDIHLEVSLQAAGNERPHVICRSNYKHLYWNMCQQLAHHTITGCNVRPGDLMASGTISGPTPDSYGSLLELTWRGERPLSLPGGHQRTFLEDGDRIVMTGWCQGEGYRVGFGDVAGRILPARPGLPIS